MSSFGRPLWRETAELVPVQMDLAGPVSRGIAVLIDAAATGGIVLVSLLIGAPGFEWEAALAVSVVAYVLGTIAFEVWLEGRSPGKALCGLRVRAEDGGPASRSALATRNALRLVDLLPGTYGLGLSSVVLDPASRRLGDRLAGTVVVIDPVGRIEHGVTPVHTPISRPLLPSAPPSPLGLAPPPAPPPTAAPPPSLPSWDVHGVGPDSLAASRTFQGRRSTMPIALRVRHGESLAAHLLATVPGADPRLPPEIVIDTVLAIVDQGSEAGGPSTASADEAPGSAARGPTRSPPPR